MNKSVKKSSVLLIVLSLFMVGFSSTASAAINWGSGVYISSYGQLVNSITYNGVTVNAIYAPRSQVSNYDSDPTFCCAAFVSKFYRSVYGIGVNNLYPGNTPNIYSGNGYFYKTTTPQVGDIAGSSEHWAIVKEVSGNTVTLIEQNAWKDKAYTTAAVNRQLILPENSYWFWRYSLSENNNVTSKADLGNNFYGAIINTERDKALTVETNNNNNIAIYTYLGRPNQIWYFTKNNDGSYRIKSCCNGESIDVCGGSSASWVNVVTWASNDSGAQKWSFYGNSPYMFVSPECNSGVLDVADAKYADGTNICINVKTGHNAQLFKVVKVDPPCVMTTPTITLNKTSYKVGDRVNISWKKTSSDTDFYQYWLIINNKTTNTQIFAGATGEAGDVEKNSYSFTTSTPGEYSVTVYSVPYNDKDSRQKVSSKNFTISSGESNTETNTTTHTYKTTITKATLSQNGKTVTKCSDCGYVSKTTTIYYPKTLTLSATSYTHDGKAKTPTVTVKDSKGNTLKKDRDYTVKYESGRKAPGKYTVTITFKGKYTGTKKLYFTIAPKATSKITATQTTTTITLKWNKVTGADGYRVYKYNSKTKKYEKLKDVTGTSLKISKLKAGTAYKYKVRAYTKDYGTIFGSYSSAFETATKCKTPSITKLTTTKGKASCTWSNVSGESGYQVYYSSKKDSGYKKVASYKTNVVKGSKSKLKSGKKYYFKVRAYKKTASGTVYSAWSSVKNIRVK